VVATGNSDSVERITNVLLSGPVAVTALATFLGINHGYANGAGMGQRETLLAVCSDHYGRMMLRYIKTKVLGW
jgi:hypothetical protein